MAKNILGDGGGTCFKEEYHQKYNFSDKCDEGRLIHIGCSAFGPRGLKMHQQQIGRSGGDFLGFLARGVESRAAHRRHLVVAVTVAAEIRDPHHLTRAWMTKWNGH